MHISEAIQNKDFNVKTAWIDTDLNVHSDTLFRRVVVWLNSFFSENHYDKEVVSEKVVEWAKKNFSKLPELEAPLNKLKALEERFTPEHGDPICNKKIHNLFKDLPLPGSSTPQVEESSASETTEPAIKDLPLPGSSTPQEVEESPASETSESAKTGEITPKTQPNKTSATSWGSWLKRGSEKTARTILPFFAFGGVACAAFLYRTEISQGYTALSQSPFNQQGDNLGKVAMLGGGLALSWLATRTINPLATRLPFPGPKNNNDNGVDAWIGKPLFYLGAAVTSCYMGREAASLLGGFSVSQGGKEMAIRAGTAALYALGMHGVNAWSGASPWVAVAGGVLESGLQFMDPFVASNRFPWLVQGVDALARFWGVQPQTAFASGAAIQSGALLYKGYQLWNS